MDVCKLPSPPQIHLNHPTSTHILAHTGTHKSTGNLMYVTVRQMKASEISVMNWTSRTLFIRDSSVYTGIGTPLYSSSKIPRFWQQNRKDVFVCSVLWKSVRQLVRMGASPNGIINTCFGCSLLRDMTENCIKWYFKCRHRRWRSMSSPRFQGSEGGKNYASGLYICWA